MIDIADIAMRNEEQIAMQIHPSESRSWTKQSEASESDIRIMVREFFAHGAGVPERVIRHLTLLEGESGGFPVDRLEHCLQSATRAAQGGESEAYIACALIHDIGDTLATFNHANFAAAIMKPYVSDELFWMLEQHDMFQGYYFWDKVGLDPHARDQFKRHAYFNTTARFVALYDDPSFDNNFKSFDLAYFEPILRRVMAKPVHGNAANAQF